MIQFCIYLPSYNICIRKENGYSCVQYTPCSEDKSFTLSTITKEDKGEIGTNCSLDFVEIIGGAASCGSTALINRYCGNKFSNAQEAAANGVVCGMYWLNKIHAGLKEIYITIFQIVLLHSQLIILLLLKQRIRWERVSTEVNV